MDITTVFGTVVGGSNPSGCTATEKANFFAFVRDSKDFSLFIVINGKIPGYVIAESIR